MIILLCTVLGLKVAFAADPPAMTVWTRDNADFLRSQFPNERIDYLDQRTAREDERREGYVPPLERDRLIKRLGLARALAPHDDLDKDLLFMYLRDANRAEMTKMTRKYPRVSLNQMMRIKRALGAVR